MTVKILIVDDEPDICELLKEILEDEHYEVVTAHNANMARPLVKSGTIDLVLLDIWMPGEDGVSLLKDWKKNYLKNVPVIMMSGHGTVETAVQATRFGAEDFLEKPITMARLLTTVTKALEKTGKQSNGRSKQLKNFGQNEFIGSGDAIETVRDRATIAAIQQKNILLLGQTGSGKKCLARLIHKVGSGAEYPFIEIGTDGLLEENAIELLLGCHKHGELKGGLILQADGGTLYLDEVTQLSELFRKTLLKILETGKYKPLGSTKDYKINCRIVFSSNKNIQTSHALQGFRKDLLCSISVISLAVPSLQERLEDVPAFIDYFVELFVSKEGLTYRSFPVDVQNYLRNYNWPGNVNEFKNIIQQLLLFGKSKEVSLDEVVSLIEEKQKEIGAVSGGFDIPTDISLREAREQFERYYLETVLKRVGGSVTKLAKISGMERTHLYRKLKTLGVSPK
jgi:DNA-binding NtrC family response regulator